MIALSPKNAYRLLLRRYGPQGWWPLAGRYRPKEYRPPSPRGSFEIAAGAVLTQNASWTNAEKALGALREKGALTPKSILALRTGTLQRLIRPSGYFSQKSKKLKILSRWWKSHAKNQRTRDQLLSLWGVGPETADSILLYALGSPYFVVDAYTRRIGSRIGWFNGALSYDGIADFFTNALGRSAPAFNEMHALIVRLAKEHCRSVPLCAGCPLRDGCAFGQAGGEQ